MSLAFVAALALASPSGSICVWDKPGVDPFKGDLVQAMDRYTDIPAPVRKALKKRMAARQYDEIATIRRDSIEGRQRYAPELRGMHFGNGRVCANTSRTGWSNTHVERGLVYCETGHCVIVPTVCRNLSRITRLPGESVAGQSDSRQALVPGLVAGGGAMTAPALGTLAPLGPALGDASASADVGGGGGGSSFIQIAWAGGYGAGQLTFTGPGFAGGGRGGGGAGGTFIDSALPANTGGADAQTPPDILTQPTDSIPGVPAVDITLTVDPLTGDLPIAVVPEPGTWALWLAGLAAILVVARRRTGAAEAAERG